MSHPPPLIPHAKLDYGSSPSRPSALGDYPFHLAVWFVALVVLAVPLMVIVSKFEQIFTDFGLKLPWLTRVLLALGRWLSGGFGWAALAAAAALLALLTAGLSPRRDAGDGRRSRLWVIPAAVVLLALGVVLVVVALFLPMMTLVEGMSSQGGGGKK